MSVAVTDGFVLMFVLHSEVEAHDSMVHSYRHGFSGFAAKLTESQAKKIAGTHRLASVLSLTMM